MEVLHPWHIFWTSWLGTGRWISIDLRKGLIEKCDNNIKMYCVMLHNILSMVKLIIISRRVSMVRFEMATDRSTRTPTKIVDVSYHDMNVESEMQKEWWKKTPKWWRTGHWSGRHGWQGRDELIWFCAPKLRYRISRDLAQTHMPRVMLSDRCHVEWQLSYVRVESKEMRTLALFLWWDRGLDESSILVRYSILYVLDSR